MNGFLLAGTVQNVCGYTTRHRQGKAMRRAQLSDKFFHTGALTASLAACIGLLSSIVSAAYAETTLPPLPQPGHAVTQAERDADVNAMRSWWYKCGKAPGPTAMIRLKNWIDAHPADAEATFFVLLGYRSNLAYDYVKPASIDTQVLITRMKQVADEGFLPAKARYALMLIGSNFMEENDPIDVDAGKRLLEQCIALGDASASFYQGELFLGGQGGFKRDFRAAGKYLEKAAEGGFTRAFASLGSNNWMLSKEKEALTWFEKGMSIGDPMAYVLFGHYRLYNTETRDDWTEGFRLFEKAAQIDPLNADAHAGMAHCYRYGMGAPADPRKAFDHYVLASNLGNKTSGMMVAIAFIEGDAVFDPSKGIEVLKLLVRRKHAPAQIYLGRLMLQGIFVERDVAGSKGLFEAAAAQGSEEAEVYLKWFAMAEERAAREKNK